MQRNAQSKFQTWLIAFLIGLAIVLSAIIFWLTRGNNAATEQPTLGAADEPTPPVTASAPGGSIPTVTVALPSSASIPTPTFVPVNSAGSSDETASSPPQAAVLASTPQPMPTEPIPATSQPLPATSQPLPATPLPPTPQPQPTTPAIPVQAQGTTVQLDDNVWGGGYRSARGYGGRSATWIYGTGTGYSSMQALFTVAAQPGGSAALTIEGMDSEDRSKTPIQILINGVEIFNAPNPLPNDDLPIESGTWASSTFPFDSALLQPGENTVQINNLKPGQFSLPPFFMLDYAVITFE